MMTLSRFSESFIATHHAIDNTAPSYEDKDFELVIRTLGGTTYEHGLYRVVIASKVASATDAISHVFPETRGRIRVFAYDWLGRHFAIDVKEQPSKRVLMLEPGAGETMEIPVPIIEFHNTELVDYPNDALAKSFYENWRQIDSREILPNECIGYKKPLFLGGEDTVTNLERSDLDVYIHICAQLRASAMKLPDGARIRDISMDNNS